MEDNGYNKMTYTVRTVIDKS